VQLVPTPSSFYLNYNFAAFVFNNVIIKIQASEIIHDIILFDVAEWKKFYIITVLFIIRHKNIEDNTIIRYRKRRYIFI